PERARGAPRPRLAAAEGRARLERSRRGAGRAGHPGKLSANRDVPAPPGAPEPARARPRSQAGAPEGVRRTIPPARVAPRPHLPAARRAGRRSGGAGGRRRIARMIPRISSWALVLTVCVLGVAAVAETRDPFAPPAALPRAAGTPLERVDIDQIRLVALVDDGRLPPAPLEDAARNGYLVRVGTPGAPPPGRGVPNEPRPPP